jgi:hypothetical protein
MSEENPCLVFFEQHEGDNRKVCALREEPDALKWEDLTASRYSPGTVKPGERVLRLAFQPLHIDPETRSLKLSAVSDLKDKGFSVDRLSYISRERCIESGSKRAANAVLEGRTPRELRAVATLGVHEVRAILVDGVQAVGVYDTAKKDNHAHADICQLVPEGRAGRSVRSRLLELCDSYLEILTN